MENPPTTIVIFGASGDLTRRKLVPALYNLYRKGRLPFDLNIIGFARREYSNQEFRFEMMESVGRFSRETFNFDLWGALAPRIHYFRGDLGVQEDYLRLAGYLQEVESGPSQRLYYLATAPEYYEPAVSGLGAAGLASEDHEHNSGHCHIIIEKPFGHDLASAQALNRAIHNYFSEHQVYRIDHYLGKETAQNILFLRFANTIFEPLWNRNYIDNVQITAAESLDVGHRAGYYDGSGVLRDIFQNHLMQLFTLVALEPPASFDADALRNEKVKVLNATRPITLAEAVRAQYQGYLQASGVAPDSHTPTYAAIKLFVDNWRWQGVPFYLRSGKALADKTTTVVIEFKRPPVMMFNMPDDRRLTPNILTLCIQPDEGVHLKFEAKQPDTILESRSVNMEFDYRSIFGDQALPEAYERLLLDAVKGDASLFARSDEIELAWKLVDPLIQDGPALTAPALASYRTGSWGPAEADALLAKDGRVWWGGCGDPELQDG